MENYKDQPIYAIVKEKLLDESVKKYIDRCVSEQERQPTEQEIEAFRKYLDAEKLLNQNAANILDKFIKHVRDENIGKPIVKPAPAIREYVIAVATLISGFAFYFYTEEQMLVAGLLTFVALLAFMLWWHSPRN